jgi:diguanylate cyclase (GGDEF)-like protein
MFSSSSTDPSKRGKPNFWQRLVEPVATITDAAERRQARLVSSILLTLGLAASTGPAPQMYVLHDPLTALILVGMTLGFGIGYLFSRTERYRLAVPLLVATLASWPAMNIALLKNYNPSGLLTTFIFDVLLIVLCSTLASFRTTIFLSATNFLVILLLPILIPAIQVRDIIVPLSFNGAMSALILVLTQHRNLMEKDRLLEVSQAKEQLQVELIERKRAEEQLVYTALHDPLTDLPNRILFMDRLRHAMERAKRHKDHKYAVLFLDLDRFKVVNDSLGHNIGDQLLIESASRLMACLRTEDTVARLGGDEFVILLEDVQDSADAIRVAERMQNDLALPYDLEGHRVNVFVSMGIVLSGADYEQPDDILRDADIAMYRAKGQGLGRFEIFDPQMLDRVMTRLESEIDLRKALERQEFIVHYQPILDMRTRRIVGFEALVRWQHPTKGLIPPAEFIPTSEETGLIVPIGYWVLDEACHQIREWQVQFPTIPPLTVSVNLSTRQCSQPDLLEKIADVLQKNELDGSCLKLELTESLIVEDSEYISAMLSKLRELGIQVQIDDFGTGYSSLGYLHTLPIDTLKIDRGFISRLGTSNNGSEIVRTILALAHNLGMKVVAEGVETDEQLSNLEVMDCEYVQGFLFAKPVDSQAAGVLLGKSINGIDS